MEKDSLKQILEHIDERLTQSHNGVANVQSSGLGEIKEKLAVHTETLEHIHMTLLEIKDYQKIQNGNVARNVKDIQDLRISDTDIRSSFKGAVWIGSALIGLILVLGGTVIELKLTSTHKKAVEDVGNLIKAHIQDDKLSK